MDEVSARADEPDIRSLRVPAASRIRDTPHGPVRLTPSELQIIRFIERHEGYPCSKAQIAAAIGRNEKTVDRLLSRMRRDGLVTSQAVHSDNGAQLANVYRLTKWAQG
ncbi:MarR family transcriptional regulator [Thermophilibacter sp.]